MKVTVVAFLVFFTGFVSGQPITDQQAKALNNYVALANHLNDELNGLGPSLSSLYYSIQTYREKKGNRGMLSYSCKVGPTAYYFEEAEKTSAGLGSKGATLQAKAKQFITSFQKVDKTCKEIEIYFRLKDYETDDFKKTETLLPGIITYVHQYKKDIEVFEVELEKLYYALQPFNINDPYQKTEKLMRDQLVFEKRLIDEWTYNINAATYTGWPNKATEEHIIQNETKIESLKKSLDLVKYPASSQYKSFIEAIASLQKSKRNAIDGNTYESQKSDGHSNDFHNNLINYYNNAAVSFYNNYNKMAAQNGFRGLNYVTCVSNFDLRTEGKAINTAVVPFVDLPYAPLKITASTTGITALVHTTLSGYVEYINEGVRQINNLSRAMANLNSGAARGKGRLEAGEKAYINYYKNNFEVPLSLFQSAINQTKNLPVGYREPLSDQAETLQSILVEINQWNTVLLDNADKKELAKDNLDHVYGVLNRYNYLVDAFDSRKERLYNDVRSVFESYKPANPKSAWIISGNELLKLVDEDHHQLYTAKKFLTKESDQKPSTEKINSLSREIVINEFDNLTGIKKLGRYNGSCPYTPYEDLAKYSLQFTEFLDKADTEKPSSYDRHPYNKLVHSYNGSLAHNYNKFVELSAAPLLKTATQLELFEVAAPIPFIPRAYAENENTQPTADQNIPKPATDNRNTASVPVAGKVIHDTVRITDVIRIETIRQDTVYINRVDTVYMGALDADALSMEGYATNNMVLLLDVSGSMNNPDKLPLLKKSVLLLLKTMREEDQISIITYSGKARVALSPTSFKEEEKIKKIVENLKSEGKTDGNAGLKLAYDVADKNYIRGGNNRIILATDGEFPIGNKSYDMVKKYSSEDIMISVFNFGKNASSTKGLEKLASLGNGNYAFITQLNVDEKLIKEAKAKRKK